MSGKQGFREVFRNAVDRLADDAKSAGTTMRDVCASVGVSRATPSRYRRKVPATIETVAKLQDEIEKRRDQNAD